MTHCRPALSEVAPILTEHAPAPSQHSLLGYIANRSTVPPHPVAIERLIITSREFDGPCTADRSRIDAPPYPREATGIRITTRPTVALFMRPSTLDSYNANRGQATKPPEFRWNPGGRARRRRDLNPRGAMHPYLLSREAHSTGLCDVSSADYFRAFSPRARTCAHSDARGRPARRRARDSNPRCHC